MYKMKKNKLSFVLSIFLILSFTSCYNPVFYEIRKDVPPEPATFESPITSIARYTVQGKEYLVISSNDGVYYKETNNAVHGSWYSLQNLPFTLHYYDSFAVEHIGQQIINVSADDSTLFLITAQYEPDDSYGITKITKISVWGIQPSLSADGITWNNCSEADWKCIIEDSDNTYFPIYDEDEYYYSAFSVFSTNAPIQSHRKVFIRRGDPEADDYNTITYYALNGMNDPVQIEAYPFIDSAEINCANSAIYFNDSFYFLNSRASITNETYASEAARFYYSNENDIYSNNADNSLETTCTVNVGNPVSSLAYCTDALLIARANYDNTSSATSSSEGGIFKVNISNGNLDSTLATFTTNAEFQLPSAYFVPVVLNATPDRTEAESYLYATTIIFGSDVSSSAASYKNVGLWSYYPERGNWNRE